MTVFWDYLPWVAPCQCTFDLLVALVGLGYPGGSDGKESDCNAGDPGSIPESGQSSGEGNGSPIQCSGLENPHGQRSLAGYSPWDHKSQTMTERLTLPFGWFLKKKIDWNQRCYKGSK